MRKKDFMEDALYLPPVMRDFHAQKDVFKLIHDKVDVTKHEYAGKVDWISGHCYVVDIFLWFMAKRGYTLQKSRMKVAFRNLQSDIEENEKTRITILKNSLLKNPPSVVTTEGP